MQLTDMLDVKCIKIPLNATEKDQAITELIDLLNEANLLNHRQTVFKAVMERESVRSTGIGQAFAIPHAKCSAVDRLVMAVGKTKEPIDFESIDNQPIDLIVLLVSPLDQTGLHVKTIARISRLMTDPKIRQQINNSSSPEQIYQLIANNQH